MGNPVIRKIPQYRKTLILSCKNLRYLDDRPVFPRDRACAEAWERGGFAEEQAERQRWIDRENARIMDSVYGLLRLRDQRRNNNRNSQQDSGMGTSLQDSESEQDSLSDNTRSERARNEDNSTENTNSREDSTDYNPTPHLDRFRVGVYVQDAEENPISQSTSHANLSELPSEDEAEILPEDVHNTECETLFGNLFSEINESENNDDESEEEEENESDSDSSSSVDFMMNGETDEDYLDYRECINDFSPKKKRYLKKKMPPLIEEIFAERNTTGEDKNKNETLQESRPMEEEEDYEEESVNRITKEEWLQAVRHVELIEEAEMRIETKEENNKEEEEEVDTVEESYQKLMMSLKEEREGLKYAKYPTQNEEKEKNSGEETMKSENTGNRFFDDMVSSMLEKKQELEEESKKDSEEKEEFKSPTYPTEKESGEEKMKSEEIGNRFFDDLVSAMLEKNQDFEEESNEVSDVKSKVYEEFNASTEASGDDITTCLLSKGNDMETKEEKFKDAGVTASLGVENESSSDEENDDDESKAYYEKLDKYATPLAEPFEDLNEESEDQIFEVMTREEMKKKSQEAVEEKVRKIVTLEEPKEEKGNIGTIKDKEIEEMFKSEVSGHCVTENIPEEVKAKGEKLYNKIGNREHESIKELLKWDKKLNCEKLHFLLPRKKIERPLSVLRPNGDNTLPKFVTTPPLKPSTSKIIFGSRKPYFQENASACVEKIGDIRKIMSDFEKELGVFIEQHGDSFRQTLKKSMELLKEFDNKLANKKSLFDNLTKDENQLQIKETDELSDDNSLETNDGDKQKPTDEESAVKIVEVDSLQKIARRLVEEKQNQHLTESNENNKQNDCVNQPNLETDAGSDVMINDAKENFIECSQDDQNDIMEDYVIKRNVTYTLEMQLAREEK